MNPRLLAAAAAFSLLSACAPVWVSPTRDDAATLTFVSEAVGGYVHVHLFANGKDCSSETRITGFGGLSGKTEIRVPPGEELAPSINIAGGNYNCSIIMSFVPEPRQSYAVLIGGTAQRCKMGIGRFDGKKFTPEPSARQRKWTGGKCE